MSRPPAPLVPQYALAWSYTRHRLLQTCERAVFWHYVGCRGAGLDNGDPDAGRAWALRHLTDLPQLLGEVVHTAARTVFDATVRGVAPPRLDDLLLGARLTLNQVWRASQPDQIDRFWRWPGAHTALREIALRGGLRDSEIAVAGARLRTCLAALVDAPLLEDLAACPREAITLPEAAPVRFAPVPNSLAWAVVDLIYRHTNMRDVTDALRAEASQSDRDLPPWRRGAAERLRAARAARLVPRRPTFCVADLKTGASVDPEREALQLGGYGLWMESAGIPRTDGVYLGRIVDLARQVDRWYVVDDDSLAAARSVIETDLAHQRRLFADPDRAIPLPKSEWALAADRRRCGACRFHPVCEGELGRNPRPSLPERITRAEPDDGRSPGTLGAASQATHTAAGPACRPAAIAVEGTAPEAGP